MPNQKGFASIPIVIAIIIVAVLSFGGYVYFFNPQLLEAPIDTSSLQQPEELEEVMLDGGSQGLPTATSPVVTNTSSSSAENSNSWINYEDDLIKFSYPEANSWSSYTGAPGRVPTFFEFSGKDGYGINAMYITKGLITEVKDNEIYNGEISPKALATKSRNYKLAAKEGEEIIKTVTDIKGITVDGKSGYYYDFQGSYADSFDGGFTTESGCRGRAVFVNSDKAVYSIIYCMRQPFEDIYKSIKLK